MAVVENTKGTAWIDGRFTAKVRAPGISPARVARVRRPFARIGSHPDAEIRIDDPAVEPAHALLLLDRRGIFGVDLLTASGTRFAGAEAGSAWLGAGDVVEVAGHRVEISRLVVDGRSIDPPLCGDDPLATAADNDLVAITLEPLGAPGPPWMLGSPLAFLGRDAGCAIRVEDPSSSKVHCALLRTPGGAHAIDLLGLATSLDGRPVVGASALLDGEVLAIGRARFVARFGAGPPGRELVRPGSAASPDALIARLIDAVERAPGTPRPDVLEAIRQLRSETAAVLGAQIDRIEDLGREIAGLRDEVRGHRGIPEPQAPPLRLDPRAPAARPTSGDPVAWLLDRFRSLGPEARPRALPKPSADVPPRGPGPADRPSR